VDVVREVPREAIKEVEMLREVAVEVTKEVPKEVPVEKLVERRVEVPVEVTRNVEVEVPVELVREIPVEVLREIPAPPQLPADVSAAGTTKRMTGESLDMDLIRVAPASSAMLPHRQAEGDDELARSGGGAGRPSSAGSRRSRSATSGHTLGACSAPGALPPAPTPALTGRNVWTTTQDRRDFASTRRWPPSGGRP